MYSKEQIAKLSLPHKLKSVFLLQKCAWNILGWVAIYKYLRNVKQVEIKLDFNVMWARLMNQKSM